MQVQVKLQHVKHQLWLLFQDKSDGVVNSAVQLYKSADLKIKSPEVEIDTRDFNIEKAKLE